MADRRRGGSPRHYPRTARLNELLRQIVADELERLDDVRLGLVTVTGVDCEPDLHRAAVYVDTVPLDGDPADEGADAATVAVLEELRPRLQGAVARQARLKRTPELAFAPDPAVRQAARIEAVLRDIDPPGRTDGDEGA